MKRIFLSISLLGAILFNYAQQPEDLSVNPYWTYNGDMSNALYQTIYDHAAEQIKERWSFVGSLKSKSEWEERQTKTKKILAEIMGEFPEKTPLNPVVTGTLKGDGFTVEKLYFESRPGYYVTGALFLPAKAGKLPAILYVCGHTNDGFKGYQRNALNYVKKGFVVLAIDPIGQGERIQYLGQNGRSQVGADTEHSYPGTQAFVSGLSAAHYFTWDGVRAVDYLISRKEVDPARIGITGRSGGGTQSAMIAAVDDRILASAPECYITTFDKLMRSAGPQDAEQNWIYALKKGFDESDFIEVRAPKPTLLVFTTRDHNFSVQGARDVYNEAKKAYIAFGAPENLTKTEDDAGHSSTPKNNLALHAFFQKHLNNPGDPKIEDVKLFSEEELRVTPTGQMLTSLKAPETMFSMNVKYSEEVLKKLQSEKQSDAYFYDDISCKAKSLSGYVEPILSRDYIFSGRHWRGDISVEKYLLKGSGNYYIPVLRLSSGQRNGKTILLMDDNGKASAAEKDGFAEKFVQKGYQVILPDMNGYGELGGGYKKGDAIIKGIPLNVWYAGLLTHKSPLAIRVEDTKIIVDFIKTLGSPGPVTGIATGVLASDLLHSAVINNDFAQIALISPLYSYQSIVMEKDYHPKFVMSTMPGVIGKYDVPDIVTAIYPLKICILNPVNALDQMVDNTVFDQTYTDARKKYGDTQNLTVSFNEKDVFMRINQWLE